MDGFDEDWIIAGTRRFTTYTNLDAGEYTFRVKGTNNDGMWRPPKGIILNDTEENKNFEGAPLFE